MHRRALKKREEEEETEEEEELSDETKRPSVAAAEVFDDGTNTFFWYRFPPLPRGSNSLTLGRRTRCWLAW